ncbi:MAG: 4-hydroxy-tetrahydrodipicolinate reductase [Alphaproteobacteria bacterium]
MKIGILGCAGRMGRALLNEVIESDGCTLVGGTERAGSPALGQDLGGLAGKDAIGLVANEDADGLIARADVVIEFSTVEATLRHVALSAEHGTAQVIGTTGFDDHAREKIVSAAARSPLVWAANMSLGVNLLLGLTERVAQSLGPEAFDIEIVEIHHRHKIDAPSGTALALGEAAARGRNVHLADVADRGRDGVTGARKTGAIGFAALRGGDVVGDHTVTFAGLGERIELTHKASDRRIYARGALHAARWLQGRPPGLYDMTDVLSLT